MCEKHIRRSGLAYWTAFEKPLLRVLGPADWEGWKALLHILWFTSKSSSLQLSMKHWCLPAQIDAALTQHIVNLQSEYIKIGPFRAHFTEKTMKILTNPFSRCCWKTFQDVPNLYASEKPTDISNHGIWNNNWFTTTLDFHKNKTNGRIWYRTNLNENWINWGNPNSRRTIQVGKLYIQSATYVKCITFNGKY